MTLEEEITLLKTVRDHYIRNVGGRHKLDYEGIAKELQSKGLGKLSSGENVFKVLSKWYNLPEMTIAMETGISGDAAPKTRRPGRPPKTTTTKTVMEEDHLTSENQEQHYKQVTKSSSPPSQSEVKKDDEASVKEESASPAKRPRRTSTRR